jgi:hypothetical protein
MKKRFVVLTLVLVLFFITTVSAGVYFSQPEENYNLGDNIIVNLTVEPIEAGFPEITLNCDGESVMVLPSSYNNGKGVIEFPLTSSWIEDMNGDCYFLAEFSNDVNGKSREFKISNELDVSLSIDSFFAEPGETITINGNARRLNGVGVNGEVEITIPLLSRFNVVEEVVSNETESSNESESNESSVEVEGSVDNGAYYGQISGGDFSVVITLPKDIPAGDYRIDALAFEEQDGERTSEGLSMANLNVFQIPTSIDVALNNQNFDPGESLNFKAILKDQTEVIISEEISVIISDEAGMRIFEQIVLSEDTFDFVIKTNQSAGYYEILASSNELESLKSFYINEKAIVSLVLDNETLIVTNVGNIPYKKDIQVDLNGKPFVKSLNLELSESHSFKLTGANQEYDIKISDGETELVQQGVALTGRAIGIKNLKGEGSISVKPIIWIFFIIVFGAGVLFLLRSVMKKKSFTYGFNKKKSKSADVVELSAPKSKPKKQGSPLVPPNQAEQVLVLQGEKSRAGIVVLKIKNKISSFSKQSLEKAIEPIYGKRGAVYEQGDYIFILFSPLMTKTTKNEVLAARAAEKIKSVLNHHNKKFKDKIEFGLAVNSGSIINKVENKKLKFTALKNVMVAAKRLAESSDGQILVTKEAYERGISEIKAEKKKIGNGDVYELRRVVDHDQNKKFLKGFVERMEQGK